MKKLATFVTAAALAFGARSLLDIEVAYAQASTVGQLRGVVKDKGTNETAVGATVVATSPALQGEQVVITDENGQYFITSLPPGMYTLTVYYNDSTFVARQRARPGRQGSRRQRHASTPRRPPASRRARSSTSPARAPIVDQGSTKTGMTITDDYTRNVPTGRTFGAAIGAAAGSQGDHVRHLVRGRDRRSRTRTSSKASTRRTRRTAGCRRTCRTSSSRRPRSSPAATTPSTAARPAVSSTSSPSRARTSSTARCSATSARRVHRRPRRRSSAEGGSIDMQVEPRQQLGRRLRARRSDHQGQAVVPRRLRPVGRERQTTRASSRRQVDANSDGVPDVDPATGLTKHDEVSRA